jgi:hypothetical protein
VESAGAASERKALTMFKGQPELHKKWQLTCQRENLYYSYVIAFFDAPSPSQAQKSFPQTVAPNAMTNC